MPELNTSAPMSGRVKKLRYLALFSHITLIVWMLIWYFLLPITADYSIVFKLLLFIVPLLLPLPGILQGKPYTHAWASFIVLLYFLHSITVLYAEPSQMLYATIELVLAIAMFVGCSGFARLRGQELGTGLPKLKTVMEAEKNLYEGKHHEQKNSNE
ncbi:DUF2069 domain-containing protein [Glaciecola sp.]|jgi:uncharacterized membrane protein|uniref:DUF2069 domain-containing protein n=1 Tax=Glaciecola sp. MF2-115 TaxID=3384827 RepID=UPI003989F141|mmetsp:Transcript_20321/g.64651  ORF Transcript_20321/g.64651 Transcript_20321/m.64651 type:complete len:157 (-) Transcript_20321:1188-1658(-)